MPKINLRQALAKGPCYGTFVKLPRFEIVDILKLAGFDFAICDMEHAQVSEIEARAMIKACVANDMPAIVRLPEPGQGLVNRLLEAGATGIQMPRLRNSADTRAVYAMMHFPPEGARSVSTANASARYGTKPLTTYLSESNERTLLVGQFETRDVERPIEEMMQGLDVAFIGPVDLSVDFGFPGQPSHPDVQARIREIEHAAARTGTVMGAFAASVDEAKRLAASGYRYLAISGDLPLLTVAARSMVDALRSKESDPTSGTRR